MGKPRKHRGAASSAPGSVKDAAHESVGTTDNKIMMSADAGPVAGVLLSGDEIMKNCTDFTSMCTDLYCMHPTDDYSMVATARFEMATTTSTDGKSERKVHIHVENLRAVGRICCAIEDIMAELPIVIGTKGTSVIRDVESGGVHYDTIPIPRSMIDVVLHIAAQIMYFKTSLEIGPVPKEHQAILMRYAILTITVKTNIGYVLAVVKLRVHRSSVDMPVVKSPRLLDYIKIDTNYMPVTFEKDDVQFDPHAIRCFVNVATEDDMVVGWSYVKSADPAKETVEWPDRWIELGKKYVLSKLRLVWKHHV